MIEALYTLIVVASVLSPTVAQDVPVVIATGLSFEDCTVLQRKADPVLGAKTPVELSDKVSIAYSYKCLLEVEDPTI